MFARQISAALFACAFLLACGTGGPVPESASLEPARSGKVDEVGDAPAPVEVLFSPQPYEESHLLRVAALVDGAEHTLDAAIYGMRDGGVIDAFLAAAERGVRVRMVMEAARGDRSDPEGTTSALLEESGIDVRWVNKIMHHKFLIADGAASLGSSAGDPEALADVMRSARIASGSANWSWSAATRYDEATIFATGHAELSGTLQREFEHMWASSRDFAWPGEPTDPEVLPLPDEWVTDDEGVESRMTSENFDVRETRYGATFTKVSGRNAVAERLVELILSAERSVDVAATHLRSRPIAEALRLLHSERPDARVRVYLDGQDFISERYAEEQQIRLVDCLAEAGDSVSKRDRCTDRGFLYSFPLHEVGVQVRFKHYSYRWHYLYAAQMHHKHIIVDERFVAAGSYNFSDNAEHNTLENVFLFDAVVHPELVASFVANFEAIWETARDDGTYESLLDLVEYGEGSFPLIYDAMALDWAEVDRLKKAIRRACPDVDSDAFRAEPQKHRECLRP